MARFTVDYTVEEWYSITIEADSAEEAREKFYNDESIDWDTKTLVGSELQDSVLVKEIN